MTIRITARRDDQAFAMTVEGADRPAVVAIRATMLATGARFANSLTALTEALTSFANASVPLAATLLPVALAPALAAKASAMVGPAFKPAVTETVAGERNDAARETRLNETPASLPFAADDRAAFRALDIAGQSAFIKAASRDQLAAILVAGRARFAELPQPLWQAAVDHHSVLAHIERTGIMADFALKPSADHPAVVGVDTAAAEAAAQIAIDRFRAERREVDYMHGILRDVIVAVAASCSISLDEAHALLCGEPA